MRVLAIESSGKAGSVALLERGQPVGTLELDPARRNAQTLAPAIAALLDQCGWKPNEVQLVAVARGPGSFTGLRVGVTTAKMFAYATGAALVGVDTLEATSLNVPQCSGRLWVVMDALRQEVFARVFSWVDGTPQPLGLTQLISRAVWLAQLAPGDCVSFVNQNPLPLGEGRKFPPGVVLLSAEFGLPRATCVGVLGLRLYMAGQCDDVFELTPAYYRQSAAEEKRVSG